MWTVIVVILEELLQTLYTKGKYLRILSSKMFHSTVSFIASNIKFCSRLKSNVLSVTPGHQQLFARSVHFLSFQNVFCEKSKLSYLNMNIVPTRNIRKRKRVDPPTDFLPFPWERGKKFSYIEGSGDKDRTLDVDPKLCKWDVDLSEELQGMDDNVRRLFSLETMVKSDLLAVNKQLLLKKVQQHPLDFDSREVKIALQTLKIKALLQHYKTMPLGKKRGKVMLIEAIQKRNKMLKTLRKVDLPCFEWLVKELGIDYNPTLPGFVPIRYTRKNELRRLTKEYCEKLIGEKRAEYHEKLKEQQKLFLEEKEEILAWIAKEEQQLGISKTDNSPAS